MQCELEFKKLNDQTDFANKVEPLYYNGVFALGVLCFLLSSNWLVVIVYDTINYWIVLDKTISSVDPSDYINKILQVCLDNNLGYFCNLIFISLAVYLLAVTFKGNQTIGFRFASPTFYPMRPNETQLNSFMFNILLMNACSLGVTMYCCA